MIQISMGNYVGNQATAYLHIYWLSHWISLDMVYFCAFRDHVTICKQIIIEFNVYRADEKIAWIYK